MIVPALRASGALSRSAYLPATSSSYSVQRQPPEDLTRALARGGELLGELVVVAT